MMEIEKFSNNSSLQDTHLKQHILYASSTIQITSSTFRNLIIIIINYFTFFRNTLYSVGNKFVNFTCFNITFDNLKTRSVSAYQIANAF